MTNREAGKNRLMNGRVCSDRHPWNFILIYTRKIFLYLISSIEKIKDLFKINSFEFHNDNNFFLNFHRMTQHQTSPHETKKSTYNNKEENSTETRLI